MGKKLDISDDDRRVMIYNGDLMEDANGDEVFTGMSRVESEEFAKLKAKAISSQWRTEAERNRYLELVDKRERVRQPFLHAEFEAKRTGRPT